MGARLFFLLQMSEVSCWLSNWFPWDKISSIKVKRNVVIEFTTIVISPHVFKQKRYSKKVYLSQSFLHLKEEQVWLFSQLHSKWKALHWTMVKYLIDFLFITKIFHIYSMNYLSCNFMMAPSQESTLILEQYTNHSYLVLHAPPFLTVSANGWYSALPWELILYCL